MYSSAQVAVDKRVAVDEGMGFDFSAITDLVKSALPVGLNIFQQQQQLRQIKATGAYNVANGMYVPNIQLPAAQMYGLQPNIGQPYPMQSSGISTTMMLSIGGAIVVGVLAYKLLR